MRHISFYNDKKIWDGSFPFIASSGILSGEELNEYSLDRIPRTLDIINIVVVSITVGCIFVTGVVSDGAIAPISGSVWSYGRECYEYYVSSRGFAASNI